MPNRRSPSILMLLSNAYDPDPRVRQEALALIGMGCRVRILAWDRDLKCNASEVTEGVDVDRVFLSSVHGRGATQLFFYAALYLKMFWRAWNTSWDIVHCHDLDTLPLGFLLAKLRRRPIVYDAHESFTDMLAASIPAFLRRGLLSLETFMMRRTDLLITVGETLRTHFAERGARRSVVVGNWKRLDDYSRSVQQNTEVRARLGIPESAMVIVCITQLLKDRKIEELLQAVEATSEAYLIIGGRGVLESTVKAWAAGNERILYIGFVPASQIPVYTCAADVVYYGFDPENPNARYSAPNKLFEALAAGRPLITGDFGEIADVVRHGACGIVLLEYSVAEIQNALIKLREQPAFRWLLAANAQRIGASAMNWHRGEEILREEYARLLPAHTLNICIGEDKHPVVKGADMVPEIKSV